jgi:hypothetical protein
MHGRRPALSAAAEFRRKSQSVLLVNRGQLLAKPRRPRKPQNPHRPHLVVGCSRRSRRRRHFFIYGDAPMIHTPQPTGCRCHDHASAPARLAGYIDASGNFQEGANPDPSYGGTLQQPPDAVLGPVDPRTGQYYFVAGANPGSTTPIFPQSGAPHPIPSWYWAVAAALAFWILIESIDTRREDPAAPRRRG